MTDSVSLFHRTEEALAPSLQLEFGVESQVYMFETQIKILDPR